MNWVRENEKTEPRLKMLFAVPNGGYRSKSTANKLKQEGVRPGVPDLLLPVPSQGHGGLAIEMKVEGGRVRPEQREWLAALREVGWYSVVCWSAYEAYRVVMWYLGYDADGTGEPSE